MHMRSFKHFELLAAAVLFATASQALADGVAAWGWNGFGQLGDGSTDNRYSPVALDGTSGVTAIAAGNGHSVALKDDGSVWVWGVNFYGQLGAETLGAAGLLLRRRR